MKQEYSDPGVCFEIIASRIPALTRRRGPFHQVESLDVSGEQQIVDHLVALAIDLRVDAMDEGALDLREVDADIVRGRSRPDGLAPEIAGPPPDAQVVAAREGVVGFFEEIGRAPCRERGEVSGESVS